MFRNFLGIRQGRLSSNANLSCFPHGNWENEFRAASALGFDFMELFVDRVNPLQNPLRDMETFQKLSRLASENRINISSICIDPFVEKSNLKDAERLLFEYTDIYESCSKLNCKNIILPLLENNETTLSELEPIVDFLRKALKVITKFDLNVLIEVNISAEQIKKIVNLVNNKKLKIVYDTGNRAFKKADINSEIKILHSLISIIHIKDKNVLNKNVFLGDGLVNFSSLFNTLRNINYQGLMILETQTGANPLETALRHLQYCDEKAILENYCFRKRLRTSN